MFGTGHTYFADSPVVIDISGLEWPKDVITNAPTSPFNIVRVEVVHNNIVYGDFRADTGGQSAISLDISSALRSVWSDYEYGAEVAKAQAALTANAGEAATRDMRLYILRIYTEYLSSDGVFTTTQCTDSVGNTDIPGGQCLIGGMTEWERSLITSDADRDVSHLEHTGARNGDASTKPISTPERVGQDSITSWVDVYADGTKSIFYPPTAIAEGDDVAGQQQGWTGHAPIVLRDSQQYIDFIFVNRRGAVETCSALMREAMNIEVDAQQYSRVERPAFRPARSLMSKSSGGRRAWQMSSGHLSREWAEWWVLEFLTARKWWMRWQDRYTPVIVEPSKDSSEIYNRAQPQMPSVEFTVTLALEG